MWGCRFERLVRPRVLRSGMMARPASNTPNGSKIRTGFPGKPLCARVGVTCSPRALRRCLRLVVPDARAHGVSISVTIVVAIALAMGV